jgi:hypothetical protein
VWHPSGTIRQTELLNGVASAYGSNIFTGDAVKYTTDGTLILTASGADSTVGAFAGCEFSSAGKYFVLPYWPAAQTYDSAGPARFYLNDDKEIVYEGQASGPVPSTERGEGINLSAAVGVGGSVYTGTSTRTLDATTTGATPATFTVQDLAPYENNVWNDAFTVLRVRIQTYQGPVA